MSAEFSVHHVTGVDISYHDFDDFTTCTLIIYADDESTVTLYSALGERLFGEAKKWLKGSDSPATKQTEPHSTNSKE